MSPEATERPVRRAALLLGASLLCTLSMGCQPAMSTSPVGKAHVGEDAMSFSKHNFSAFCYNTHGCRVTYNGFRFVDQSSDETSPPPNGPDYRKAWGGAMYGGIDNFPAPAEVQWSSLDGQHHEARVDLATIFRDERILHDVAPGDLATATAPTSGYPDIFLEINDRTVTVYMKALVFLRDGAGGKPARDDAIVAWTRTY